MIDLPLGRTVITTNANGVLDWADIAPAIERHRRGDWGDVCKEDAAVNDIAVKVGSRVLSSYKTDSGVEFWILTEADRSVTTVLLPEDY